MVGWLTKPHVSRWWRGLNTLELVKDEFESCIDGSEPSLVFIAIVKQKPIGLIQTYAVSDYPDHAKSVGLDRAVGIDLFIGEENYINKGYGTVMLGEFIDSVIKQKYKSFDLVVADPETANTASIRAFEKAGFKKGKLVSGEYGLEQLMIARI